MEKKNKNTRILFCPKCMKETTVIKHGKRNGIQRYKCKGCGKTFNDPSIKKIKYERNTKRVLTLLLNLLENNFFCEEYLDKAIQLTDKTKELAVKVKFNTHFAQEYENKPTCKIGCSNPKLLICQDENSITFIQMPSFDKEKCKRTGKEMLEGKSSRTITLVDDKYQNEANKRYNKTYIK